MNSNVFIFWFKYDLGQKYQAPQGRVGFELMTSRSLQYISCYWDACSNHLAISDSFSLALHIHYNNSKLTYLLVYKAAAVSRGLFITLQSCSSVSWGLFITLQSCSSVSWGLFITRMNKCRLYVHYIYNRLIVRHHFHQVVTTGLLTLERAAGLLIWVTCV